MDPLAPVFAKALRYLSFRPRSEKEIRIYLLGKHKPQKKQFIPPSIEIIDAVIIKLKELKFVDDLSFAQSFVRSRTEYKPKSAMLIKMELKQKGVSDEIIDDVLQSRTEDSDTTLAMNLLEKRKNRYEGMEKGELQQKAGGFLARKGFSWSVIKGAIDAVFDKS